SREQLGSLLLEAGSPQSALPHLEEWVRLQPRSPRALLALAEAHMALGNREQASELAQRSSALGPRDAALWVRLGELHSKQGLAAQAELAFQRAIELDPAAPAAWIRLAGLLRVGGRLEEAKACAEQALAHDPRAAPALAAKGILQDLTGREAEAESLLRGALQAAPQDADIGHSLAICRLRHWHFDDGWKGFELRRHKENFIGRYRKFPFAEWQGEPLTGKTILVYPEQGLGDEIMYGSCIPELMARARHVAVECDHKLGALFARSFPGCTVTARRRTM